MLLRNLCFLLATSWSALQVEAFVSRTSSQMEGSSSCIVLSANKEDGENMNPIQGFFKEMGDMFDNWDDQMDDFFNKRMGNGETFYGKRKFKPSGNVQGEYNGMGLTDKVRIDLARERKEIFLQERERKRAEAEKRK